MQECSHHGSYLGQPFCRFKSKTAAFQPLVEKLALRLSGWKQRYLSAAGTTTLIKAVALALPSYVMQTSLLPVSTCRTMDAMVRKFWWGGLEAHRGLYLRAWDTLCVPKCSGGLGFRRFRDINTAFITKLGWQVCKDVTRP